MLCMLTSCTDYGYDTTIPAEGETLESERLKTTYGRYLLNLAIKVRVSCLHPTTVKLITQFHE
jgi:hypothetical protein